MTLTLTSEEAFDLLDLLEEVNSEDESLRTIEQKLLDSTYAKG